MANELLTAEVARGIQHRRAVAESNRNLKNLIALSFMYIRRAAENNKGGTRVPVNGPEPDLVEALKKLGYDVRKVVDEESDQKKVTGYDVTWS